MNTRQVFGLSPTTRPSYRSILITNTSIIAQPSLVYVGTYTELADGQHRPDGIFVYRMDPATGALRLVSEVASLPNPSFLNIAPCGSILVAVSETDQYEGQNGGAVSAYAIDPSSGALMLINSRPTCGAAPCHVSIDPSGHWVIVSNYTGGNVSVLPLREDGHLGPPTDVVQHQGSSVHPSCQATAHVHSAIFAPGSPTRLLVADLGLDRIMQYNLQPATGKLLPHTTPYIPLHPGAGPRHLAFSQDGQTLYVVNEIDSTVSVFRYHPTSGNFSDQQCLPLLPPTFTGQNSSADIHLTPSGKFLYASNRGLDTLAVFSVDTAGGQLTAAGQASSQGMTPRSFAIDPSGTFLLAANQHSDSIVPLRIDPATGALTAGGPLATVPSPVCIKFR